MALNSARVIGQRWYIPYILYLVSCLVMVRAATVSVPCCSLSALNATIAQRATGDIITLGAGTFTGCPMTLDGVMNSLSLTIVGNASGTVFDCQGAGPTLLRLSTTTASVVHTFQNIQFKGMIGTTAHGLRFAGAGNAVFQACSITDNSHQDAGGNFRVLSFEGTGSLTVTDSSIARNNCSCGGVGIYAPAGTVQVTNTTVQLNRATASSSGLLVGNNVNITSCYISQNTATRLFVGSGVAATPTNFTLSASTVSANSVTYVAQSTTAIRLSLVNTFIANHSVTNLINFNVAGARLSLRDGALLYNTASNDLVFLTSVPISVSGTNLLNNQVVTGAAGLNIQQANATLDRLMISNSRGTAAALNFAGPTGTLFINNCVINQNTAVGATNGVGAYITNTQYALIQNSIFSYNTGTLSTGAGLYLSPSVVTAIISGTSFTGNGGTYGSGIYQGAPGCQIFASTFTANTANEGPGVYVATTRVLISGSQFVSNYGTSRGGAISSTGGIITMTLNDTILSGNAVSQIDFSNRGGALYIEAYGTPATFVFSNTTFSLNTAFQGGAAVLLGNNAIINFVDSTMSQNLATAGVDIYNGDPAIQSGSALYVEGFGMQITMSRFSVVKHRPYSGSGTICFNTQGFVLNILDSLFLGNSAVAYGGALYIARVSSVSSITVLRTQFIENLGGGNNNGGSKYGSGGALSLGGHIALTIRGCTFDGNQAGSGGAVWFYPDIPLPWEINDNLFVRNLADDPDTNHGSGSALNIFGSGDPAVVTLANNVFLNGRTAADPSGVLTAVTLGSMSIVVRNCSFINNQFGGLALRRTAGYTYLTVSGCSFTDNGVLPPLTALTYNTNALYVYNSTFLRNSNACQLNIVNGWSPSWATGGAILSLVDVHVENSVFALNSALTGGGVVAINEYSPYNTITMKNCVFDSNQGGLAGVISNMHWNPIGQNYEVNKQMDVTFESCQFIANRGSATGLAAALSFYGPIPPVIIDCSFNGHTGDLPLIQCDTCTTFPFYGHTFRGNNIVSLLSVFMMNNLPLYEFQITLDSNVVQRLFSFGGAPFKLAISDNYWSSSTTLALLDGPVISLSVMDSTFKASTAASTLFTATGPVTITNSSFSDSYSQLGADWIKVSGTPLNITSSSFGTAQMLGGAVVSASSSSVTLTDVVFTGNTGSVIKLAGSTLTAVDLGIGSTTSTLAFQASSSTVKLRNFSFSANKQSGGAGLFSVTGGSVSVNNSYIGSNSANGGAVISLTSTVLQMDNATFFANAGGVAGVSLTSTSASVTNVAMSSHVGASHGGFSLTGSSLRIRNMLISGNQGPVSTGLALSSSSSADVANVTATFNRQTVMLVSDVTSTLSLTQSTFSSNTGPSASCLSSAAPQTLSNCAFLNNRANTGNGAVVFQNTATVRNCVFSYNTAQLGGGAIWAAAPLTLANLTMSNNGAQQGGAVSGTTISVSNVLFAMNTAVGGDGGAVSGTTVTVDNSTFTLNGVLGGANGGALAGTTVVRNSTFTYNTAEGDGGAINGPSADVKRSTFISNRSQMKRGGAIFSPTIVVDKSSFYSNYAATEGGSLASQGTITITSSTVNMSSAATGGAVRAGTLNSANSTFVYNFANTRGGAVFAAAVSSLGDTISSNTANGNGGAVYATITMNIDSGVVKNNQAMGAGVGGGLYCEDCNAQIRGSTVTLNTASSGPGFFCTDGHLDTQPGVFSQNTARRDANLPEAECSACGCCDAPAGAFFPVHNCVFLPGFSCAYGCVAGYNISSPSITCATPGAFIDACHPLPCPTPIDLGLDPTAMHWSYGCVDNSFPAPHTDCNVTFQCNFGYKPTFGRPASAHCLAPDWSPPITFECLPAPCGGLDPGIGGTLNVTNGTGITGDIAKLTCGPGYTLPDVSLASCNLDTTGWDPDHFTCIPNPCNVTKADHRSVYPPSGMFTGDKVRVACEEPDWIRTSDEYSFCIQGTEFDPPLSTCTRAPCGPLSPPENGVLTIQVGNYSGGLATFACNDGFLISSAVTMPCVGRVWQGIPPTCRPIECAINDDRLVPDDDCTDPQHVGYKHACLMTCRPGTVGTPNVAVNCTSDQVFTPSLGSITCQQCPITSFGPFGAPACIPCTNGHVGSTNATDRTECLCDKGFYELPIGTGDCSACPAGGFCPGDKVQPLAASGFFPTSDPLKFAPCTPAESCPGNGTCLTGYTGYLCGKCDVDYYKVSGVCKPCPKDSKVRVALFIILILIASTGLIKIAQPGAIGMRTYGTVSITIAINFMQVVATMVVTSLSWSPGAKNLMIGLSAISLNIELAAPECAVHLDYYSRFQAQLLAPIAVFGTMFLAALVWMLYAYIAAKRPTCAAFKPRIINIAKSSVAGFMLFMTIAYLILAQAALSIFACSTQVGGFAVLTTSPTDRCYETPEWKSNAVLAVFSIIVYVLGVPVAILGMFLRQRYHYGIGAAREDPLAYFFVNKYHPNKWFWEALVMVRKFFVVVVALFFTQSPFVQVILCAFVFFLGAVLSLINRPFRFYWHNVLDDSSLVCCLLIIFGGLATSSSIGDAGTTAVDVLVIIAIAAVLVFIAVVLGMELYVMYNVAKIRQRQVNSGQTIAVRAHAKDKGVAAIALDPTHDRVFFSAGADGMVVAIDNQGAEPTVVAERSFQVHDVVSLVPVTESEYMAVVTTGEIQLWQVVIPPRKSATITVDGGVAVSSAIMTANRTLCIGLANGHVRLYRVFVPALDKTRHRSMRRDSIFETIDDDNASMLSLSFTSPLALVHPDDADAFATHDDGNFLSVGGSGAPPLLPAGGLPPIMPPPPPSMAPPPLPASGSVGEDLSKLGGPDQDVSSVTFVKEFEGAHSSAVVGLARSTYFLYSLSAQSVARWSPKRDGLLTEWRIDSLKEGQSLTCLAVVGPYIFAGATNTLIYRVHMENSTFTILSGHTAAISSLYADRDQLVSTGLDGTVRIWNAKTCAVVQKLPESDIPATVGHLHGLMVIWGRASGQVASFTMDPDWNYRSPDIVLEPLYVRFPKLRPRYLRAAREYKVDAGHDTSSSVRMHLLMEDFKLDDMADAEADVVSVAMEESQYR